MAFTVTPFVDLPVVDEPWNPRDQTMSEMMGEVLGPDGDDWARMKKAHLVYDSEAPNVRASYKLPVARMVDGELKVVFRQVSAAVAAINGARGGVDLPHSVRQDAFDHAIRYYRKFGVDEESFPQFRETLKHAIVKLDEKKQLVFGWANISIRSDGEIITDLHDDIILPDTLEDAAYKFVLDFRDAGMMHVGESEGDLVESFFVTPEKLQVMGLQSGVAPRVGWWTGFKVSKKAFASVMAGKTKMFSIQGTCEKEEVESNAV